MRLRIGLFVSALCLLVALPAHPEILFSDNFNRANGALGGNWTNNEGTADVQSSQVTCGSSACSSAGETARNSTVDQANYYVSAYVVQSTGSIGTQVACRVGAGRNFYGIGYHAAEGAYKLTKDNAEIASAARTQSANRRMTVQCTSTTINGYEDGVDFGLTTTDITYATGQPGFFDGVQGANVAIIDNLAACTTLAECDAFAQTGEAAAQTRIPAVLGTPSVY